MAAAVRLDVQVNSGQATTALNATAQALGTVEKAGQKATSTLTQGFVGVGNAAAQQQTQMLKLAQSTDVFSNAQQKAAMRMERMHEEALKMNTGFVATSDSAEIMGRNLNALQGVVTSTAGAFGVSSSALAPLNSAMSLGSIGFDKLKTSAVGFNTASIGVAGAGLAIGAAIGTWLNTFPAVQKVVDGVRDSLYRLVTGMEAADQRASGTAGLSKWQADMAKSAEEARASQVASLKAMGQTEEQILATLTGKHKAKTSAVIDGLTKEVDSQKKAQAAVEAHSKAIDSLASSLSRGSIAKQLSDMDEAIRRAIASGGGLSAQGLAAAAEMAAKAYAENLKIPPNVAAAAAQHLGNQLKEIAERAGQYLQDAPPINPLDWMMPDERAQTYIIEEIKGTAEEIKKVDDQLTEMAKKAQDAAAKAFRDMWMAAADGADQAASIFSDVDQLLGDMGVSADSTGRRVVTLFAQAAQGAASFMAGMASGNPAQMFSGITQVVSGLFGFLGASSRAREEALRMANEVRKAREAFIESAGGIEILKLRAEEAGVSLNAVFNARTVDEFEAAVQRVNEAFELQDEAIAKTKEAMEKWGLSAADMGPQFRQGLFHESLLEIWQDFQLLTAAGADAATILGDPGNPDSMASAMNALVQQSIAAGVALPESMRPMIEEMIRLGLLFDENGQAITDISQLPFTETLEAGVARLIEQIERLVNALLGIPPEVNTNVNVTETHTLNPGGGGSHYVPQDDGGGSDGDPSTPFAEGGIVYPRPGGTRAILAEANETEFVVPESKADDFATKRLGGGGRAPVVQVFLGTREMRDVMTRYNEAGF